MAKVKRYVRSHKKSKGGCQTCKQRRVRCDERKPQCERCLKGHYQCQYVAVRTWTFPPQQTEVSAPAQALAASLCSPQHSLSMICADPNEARAYAYFLEQTGPAFARESAVSQEFFRVFVPRVAVSEKMVWNAVVAIASRFECNSQLDERRKKDCQVLSLKHYGRALASLTRDMHTISPDLAVLCALLLTAYSNSNLDGDPQTTGIAHLTHGLRITQQDQKMPARAVDHHLHAFTRSMLADLALFTAACSTPPDTAQVLAPAEIVAPSFPESFQNLEEAKELLFEIIRWRFFTLWRNRNSNERGILVDAQRKLSRWYELVRSYQYVCHQPNPIEAMAASYMLFQSKILAMGFDESSHAVAQQSQIHTVSVNLLEPNRVILVLLHLKGLPSTLMDGGRPKTNGLDIWPLATAYGVGDREHLINITFQR